MENEQSEESGEEDGFSELEKRSEESGAEEEAKASGESPGAVMHRVHTRGFAVQAACWNIQGLADYKQESFLQTIRRERIDVLAVSETHLVHSEQQAQWQRQLLASAHFVWFGRPAVRLPGQGEHGRGSGGVGILLRKDWAQHATLMPECENDRLLFVRLLLPSAPFPIFFGVVYLAPAGCTRAAENADVLDELEDRAEQYQSQGMLCVMGDFNVHIADCPSALINPNIEPDVMRSEPVDAGESGVTLLHRSSVDTSGADEPRGVSAAGAAFVDRMDLAGLIVLNGLRDVGDGSIALATRGLGSVIDYIVVDSAHLHLMGSVQIRHDAKAEVNSDHQLVAATITFRCSNPPDNVVASSTLLPDSIALHLSTTRYRTDAQGDLRYWSEYETECGRVLGAMADRWRTSRETGVRLGVEAMTAEFNAAVDAIARATIGMRRAPSDGPHRRKASRRPVDPAVRVWKRQRKKLVRQMAAMGPVDRSAYEALVALERLLSGRIKRHLRKAVRARENEEIERIRGLRADQPRAHWKALQALVPSSDAAAACAPSSAMDSAGQVHSDAEGIRGVWLDFWSSLAKHDAADPRYDALFHAEVMQSAREEQANEGCRPLSAAEANAAHHLNYPVTLSEVRCSVRSLLTAKAPGCDGLTAEVLKNGGDAMERALRELCSLCFQRGDVPMAWLRGVVVPLHKDGSMQLPSNYRPITLLSIVGKVYTGVLQERLMRWSESSGIIVAEQGGFRPGRGCPEQLYTLTELIKLRRLRRLMTHACFIDIRKAYDTVWHEGLKLRMRQAGIHGPMYRALCSLYSACESTVRLPGDAGYTEFFSIETGVRQGCILSPLLYSIFINELAVELKASGLGATIDAAGAHKLCVLLYADDIVLLSDALSDLESLMRIVAAYARKWRFEVNHAKCGAMRFNLSGRALPIAPPPMMGGTPVPWVASYKYLGVELSNSPGHPFLSFRKRMLGGARARSARIAAMGMFSGKLPVPLGVQVYQALVRPLLEFGAEVWSADCPWTEAERLQMRVAKQILQCPIRTSGAAAMGELGWQSLEARWQQLRLCFWSKVLRSSAASPIRRVYDESVRFHSQHASVEDFVPSAAAAEGWEIYRTRSVNGISSLWCAQLQRDLFSVGLESVWNSPTAGALTISHATWKEKVRIAVSIREQCRWWRQIQQSASLSLLASLKYSSRLQREAYLEISHGGWNDRIHIGRMALTALRTGASTLRVHTGHWEHLDRDLCLCSMCGTAVQTEEHLLLDCSAFDSARAQLYSMLESWLQQAEAAQSIPQQTVWRVRDESAATRMQLLLSGHHLRIAAAGLTRRALRLILIAVGQWLQQHEDHRQSIRDICGN